MSKEILHTEDDLRYMLEKYIQNRDERTFKQLNLMLNADYIMGLTKDEQPKNLSPTPPPPPPPPPPSRFLKEGNVPPKPKNYPF